MKRLLAATTLVAMCCLAQPAGNVWGKDWPPKNMHENTGWLPGPNVTLAVPPFRGAAPERPIKHPGPVSRYTPPSGGNRSAATPIVPLPPPRSIGNGPRATVKTIERPNTLLRGSQLRLPPRPLATPIQLP
jgi:hypothetical protein